MLAIWAMTLAKLLNIRKQETADFSAVSFMRKKRLNAIIDMKGDVAMNRTFFIPMSFNVASFRKTKMMKKIGGTHFSTRKYAKDAQKTLKPQNFMIDTIFAGNFKRQPVYTPAVYAIFEVSLPDYMAESVLHTASMCKDTKKYGRIFAQVVEPEHLSAIHFYITEDLLHKEQYITLTKEDGFIHEDVAKEVDNRIIALERLAQAAARTPKSILSLIKWNDQETLNNIRKIYSHDSLFAERPWSMYPHGLWVYLLYNLLGQCGLEIALKHEILCNLPDADDELFQSKVSFTNKAKERLEKLKDGVSVDEQERIQKFIDNIQQEVDNIWWSLDAEYINSDHLGRVVINFKEPVMVDPDGYHGEKNTEMILLRAFGTKTYLMPEELRTETLDITQAVDVYEAKAKFAAETSGEKQTELTLFLTASELVHSNDKLMSTYARHVRNDLFNVVFHEYPETIFNFAFHERLYLMYLTKYVSPQIETEFRMRSSNAAIMLRESGEINPKAVVLGAQEAVAALKRKYPTEDFSTVENTVKEHMSLFK